MNSSGSRGGRASGTWLATASFAGDSSWIMGGSGEAATMSIVISPGGVLLNVMIKSALSENWSEVSMKFYEDTECNC